VNVKAVIVAAGYGSRFLPATKTVPKEMLPLIDRPAIAFIVDELVAAGVRDVLVISSRRKKALDDYFDRETELEAVFRNEGKTDKLAKIAPPELNVSFARQQEMRGTGHALLLAETFAGDDPFLAVYPDDLVFGAKPLAAQLIDAHRQTGASVLAVQDLSGQDVSRYGVVEPAGPGNPCPARRLVEKPAPGAEPSSLISVGRYLFTPELFPHLREGWARHGDGEFYHIDAINRLGAAGKLHALAFEGERLDVGEPLGYLEAICRHALARDDLAPQARALFARLSKR